MGTPSTSFLQRLGANFKVIFSVKTSAGAADADAVVALNDDGQIDHTMLDEAAASAGAADAGKVVVLNGAGVIDETMLPTGMGADVALVQASEALAAGDYVNIYDSGASTFRVRKADATSSGKACHGFVRAAVANGADATVYFEGTNDQVTGQTPGPVYLSNVTPGLGMSSTAGLVAGQIAQQLGVAVAAASVKFEPQSFIEL
jgi:hypothetical protein